jgi:hypothetical protein
VKSKNGKEKQMPLAASESASRHIAAMSPSARNYVRDQRRFAPFYALLAEKGIILTPTQKAIAGITQP